MKTIFVAGLAPLEVAGLKSLLDGWNISEIPQTGKDADIMLISPDMLAADFDFFINHRKKTIIYQRQNTDIILNHIHTLEARLKEEKSESPQILSARELDVLREVASGKTNKEIADALCISVNTVITHRKNLSSKLGIRSASGLSLYALMNGIIEK